MWGGFKGSSTGDVWWTMLMPNKDIMIDGKPYRQFIGTPDNIFLREDTTSRKVFIRYQQSATESILYDFSLQIGDSFYFKFPVAGEPNDSYSAWYLLDSIFTSYIPNTNVPSEQRRFFRFKSNYPPKYKNRKIYWIEGIGTTSYPIYMYDCFSLDTATSQYGCNTSLQCMKDGDSLVYKSTNFCETEMNNSIEKTSTYSDYIFCSPNPANDKITIKTSTHRINSFSIFDLTGRAIIPIQPFLNEEIDVSSIKDGVFFINFTTSDNTVIFKKIIKNSILKTDN